MNYQKNQWMDENIDRSIEKLICKEETKAALTQILNVAKNSKEDIKATIPHIHLVSEEGSGITTFSKIYSEIISNYNVFPQRGCNTFLELKYPKDATAEEYMRFLQSARDAAGTQNKYWGTFLVRISEWSKKCDLDNPHFLKLMDYAAKNRANIKFIFHTLPDAENEDVIGSFLKQYINIKQVCIKNPDINDWIEYAFKRASEKNILMELQAQKLFREIVVRFSEKPYFRGFSSVEDMISIIKYECGSCQFESVLTREHLEFIQQTILYEDKISREKKIGFN